MYKTALIEPNLELLVQGKFGELIWSTESRMPRHEIDKISGATNGNGAQEIGTLYGLFRGALNLHAPKKPVRCV